MSTATLPFAVVIATLNRPGPLGDALESLSRQGKPLEQLIVVDQSEDDATKTVFESFSGRHPDAAREFCYVRQSEKSLVRARNRGLEKVRAAYVTFLDDDVVLAPGYFDRLLAVFESDRGVGGLSGNASSAPAPGGFKAALRNVLMRLFLVGGHDGRMTLSGFGFPIVDRAVERVTPVRMLPGCNMSFRTSSVGSERFDEWFTGYAFREDVDFSYRISKKARLLMLPDARLEHRYAPENRLGSAPLKEMEIRNYRHVFAKHRSAWLWPLFFYTLAGLLLMACFEALLSPRDRNKSDKLKAGLRATMRLGGGENP